MSKRTRLFASPLSVLALFALLGAASDSRAERPAFLRSDRDFADPFVLRDGEHYLAFGTGSGGTHLQVARSEDLVRWSVLPDALPTLPPWAASTAGTTWAPSVLRRAGSYVLYYTARDAGTGFQCISRAVSSTPAGPYVDASASPFVCDPGTCGAIDPSPFVDDEGSAYLLWKTDENSSRCRRASRLWSQRLSDDGLGLVGDAKPLLVADRPWEQPLIEAPSMFRDGGRYYLFYSANWYESASYAIGYATCEGPTGPCVKETVDHGVIQSSLALLGPGGQEFFRDATGAAWMTYHAWPASTGASYATGGARALHVARLRFDHGRPQIIETSPP
jgi:beta-xylosidase